MSSSYTPDALFLSLQQALAGRYSLDRELGRGGMGVVYLAREVRLDRPVAIKVLPPAFAADTDNRERFLAEARTSARLAHPHIVPIYAVDVVHDLAFYVMGYVDGESLAQRVMTRGPLPAREGARVVREVAWALAHAHAQGVVHRDVKPDNILIERDSGRAVVLDFGIAAAMGANTDGVIGTPAFMSPEQVLGGVLDARSDLYALGATAFYAFSGRVPFEGDDLTVLAMHLSKDAPSLATVEMHTPRFVVQLVAQCLAKAREDRPRDAQQVAELIDKGLSARREMPAVLRGFVKREGRIDGLGAVGIMLVASAVGIVVAMNGGTLVSLFAVSYGLMLAAAGAFAVRGAHRLLRDGYTHADLSAAFEAEIESLREERRLRHRPWLARLERLSTAVLRGTVGVMALIAAAYFAAPEGVTADPDLLLTMTVLGIACLSGLVWSAARLLQRDDTLFWRRVWSGHVGRWSFALARRFGGRLVAPVAMTHRATELSLSLAAEQLFEALPSTVRRQLPEVPGLLQRLHEGAATLRARALRLDDMLVSAMSGEALDTVRAERERVAVQLEETVGALERVRLDLLRLHAGTVSVDGVTTHVQAADEVNRQIARHLDARREVDDLFGDVRVGAGNAPTATAAAGAAPTPNTHVAERR